MSLPTTPTTSLPFATNKILISLNTKAVADRSTTSVRFLAKKYGDTLPEDTTFAEYFDSFKVNRFANVGSTRGVEGMALKPTDREHTGEYLRY